MAKLNPTWCLGRDGEIEQLHRLFERHSLVSIIAPGGMGKTRLSEAFRQSVGAHAQTWFVPLADVDHAEDFIAEHLGVQPERLLHMLQNVVDPFIVLDNAESAMDDVRTFAQRVAETLPHLRLLVTSRQPLDLQHEAVLRLGSLDRATSAEVIKIRAERFGISVDDGQEMQQLLDELGGIPLALELAASRLLTHDLKSLVEQIRKSRHVLRAATNELSERHRELELTLADSWSELPIPLRRGAGRLSVFVDTFDVDAANALVDLDVLEGLIRRSWVERLTTPRGVRFRLSGILRAFCRDELRKDKDGFQDALSTATRHFITRDMVGEESRCEAEWMDNLFFAVPLLSDAALRVKAALAIEYPARIRFSYRRWDKLLAELLDDPAIEKPEWRAAIIDARGLAAIASARLDDAHACCEAAWELVSDRTDSVLKGSILISRGMIATERGNVEAGVTLTERALEEVGDEHPNVRIRALLKLAGHMCVAGDMERALQIAREASYLAEQLDDDYECGRAHGVRGVIMMGAGDFTASKSATERALEIHTRMGDIESIIMSLTNLGNLDLIYRDLDQAEARFNRALSLSQETGNASSEAIALEGLATVHFERGDIAISMLEEAARLVEPLEAYYERLEIAVSLAAHAMRGKQWALARSALTSAARVAAMMQIPSWSASVAALQALMCGFDGDAGGAEGYLVAARTFEEIDWRAHTAAITSLIDNAPFDRAAAERDAQKLDTEPWRSPPAWIRHNPIRLCLQLTQPVSNAPKTLRITRDGRSVTMPDGTEHDFSRRGPLRLIVLALAKQAGGDVLTVDDVIAAGWPGERILPDAARLRVYTTIKRLRNMGFADWLETTDEGYRFSPELRVELNSA